MVLWDFCPLALKIARVPSGFHLKNYESYYWKIKRIKLHISHLPLSGKLIGEVIVRADASLFRITVGKYFRSN